MQEKGSRDCGGATVQHQTVSETVVGYIPTRRNELFLYPHCVYNFLKIGAVSGKWIVLILPTLLYSVK